MKSIIVLIMALLNLEFFMMPENKFSAEKMKVEINKQSGERDLHTVSIYNDSDSILCIITSLFGKYRKDSIIVLTPWPKRTEKLVYKIDFNLKDTKHDFQVPIKRKICILPYQAVSFSIRLPEIEPKMELQIEHFYTNNYDYQKSNNETKNPLWYKKHKLRLLAKEFP